MENNLLNANQQRISPLQNPAMVHHSNQIHLCGHESAFTFMRHHLLFRGL